MKPDLEPAKKIIRSFLAEIKAAVEMQRGISAPVSLPFSIQDRTPDLNRIEFEPEPTSSVEKEQAYIWLYAKPKHFRSLMHRPKLPEAPEYYRQPALPIYQEWHALEKEIFGRGCIIPLPEAVSLGDYLQQLGLMITERYEKRAVWIKSLGSFLQFIREDTDLDQQGALEVLFPRKRKFENGYSFQKTEKGVGKVEYRYILRIVDEEIYPIDIWVASDILKNLAHTVLHGRPNSQHTAAEALGFAWLCHAIGSSQLMTLTTQEIIHESLLAALKLVKLEESEKYFLPECYFTIPTFYGPVDIPISKTLYDFLIALPRSQESLRIFSRPPSSLLRTFYDKGVNASERAQKLGKITFRTFTSRPHEVFNYRSPPMKKALQAQEKMKL